MQKSRNYFSMKSYSAFSAKMFKVMDHYPRFHHSEVYTIIWYTVYLYCQKTKVKTAKNG